MTFADITIVPVAEDRKSEHLAFSRRMAEVYRDHGATRIVDYWQASTSAHPDDFHAEGTSYDSDVLQGIAGIAGASPAESVVVTVIEWPSREARDRGNTAAITDPRITATLDETPIFDGSRVAGESFEITMDLRQDE